MGQNQSRSGERIELLHSSGNVASSDTSAANEPAAVASGEPSLWTRFKRVPLRRKLLWLFAGMTLGSMAGSSIRDMEARDSVRLLNNELADLNQTNCGTHITPGFGQHYRYICGALQQVPAGQPHCDYAQLDDMTDTCQDIESTLEQEDNASMVSLFSAVAFSVCLVLELKSRLGIACTASPGEDTQTTESASEQAGYYQAVQR